MTDIMCNRLSHSGDGMLFILKNLFYFKLFIIHTVSKVRFRNDSRWCLYYRQASFETC